MSENFMNKMNEAINFLHKKGAFLTVKYGDTVNTMTIGWGNIGFEWGKPIFTILVRKSRYTHELLEKANEFTICIPMNSEFKESLAYCGTKSGSDVDKIKHCRLVLKKSEKVESPLFSGCGICYECKVVFKHDIDLETLDEEIKKKFYTGDVIHTLYYAEIVKCHFS